MDIRKTIFDICKRVANDRYYEPYMNEVLRMGYLDYFGKGNDTNNDRFILSLWNYINDNLYLDRLNHNCDISTSELNTAFENHEMEWFENGND